MFGSLGALLLPVVLVADLALLVVALGVTAWPLMPVTLAAECTALCRCQPPSASTRSPIALKKLGSLGSGRK
jgi:hypothetical protein